jgi:hypothetical protein
VEKVRMLPGKEKVVRVTSKGGAAAVPTTGPDPAGPHPEPLPAGEGAGTGETAGGSISSTSSAEASAKADKRHAPAPLFWLTDSGAGLGVAGRF